MHEHAVLLHNFCVIHVVPSGFFHSGSHSESRTLLLCSSWIISHLIGGSLPISLVVVPPPSPRVYEEQLSRAWPEVGCGWQAGCSHPTQSPLSARGRWGQRRALSLSFSLPHIHTQAHKEALVQPRGAMLPEHTDQLLLCFASLFPTLLLFCMEEEHTFRGLHSHASLPCASERPVLVRAVTYFRAIIQLLFHFVKCHLSR